MNNKLIKLLLLTVVFKQLIWIAFVPLWQFPDEQAHFGQIANKIENKSNNYALNVTREIILSEQILGTLRDWAGNNRYTYHPQYNIDYSQTTSGIEEEKIINFGLDNRGIMEKTESTLYPPLYYFPGEWLYGLLYGKNLLIRVFSVRLINLVYFFAFTFFAFKIFQLIFKNDRFALFGTTIVIFQPMFSFAMSGVNSDVLFNLLSLLAAYIGLLIINNGFKFQYLLFVIINILALIFTKPQGYIIGLFYFFPLLYRIYKKNHKAALMFCLGLIIAIIFLIYQKIAGGNQLIPDIDLNNLQHKVNVFTYLKDISSQFYRQTFAWYWGVFRWLSLTFPLPIYKVIKISCAVLAVGFVGFLVKSAKDKTKSLKRVNAFYLIFICSVYLLFILLWNYLFILSRGFSFGIQGRYFFPVIIGLTGILLFGVDGLVNKINLRSKMYALIGIFMIVFHEFGLFYVLLSYYDHRLSHFFIQASQYKPWFFKSPFLEIILIGHFLSLVWYFWLLVIKSRYAKTDIYADTALLQ